MKTNKLFMVVFAAIVMQSAVSYADDNMIPVEQLPASAQTFVRENFPNSTVIYVEKDGYIISTYEAHLSDGTTVEFDRNGIWDTVDAHQASVPAHLIPTGIANYVRRHFPGAQIVKIDKKRYGHEIELSNDLDLKFSLAGALIVLDD